MPRAALVATSLSLVCLLGCGETAPADTSVQLWSSRGLAQAHVSFVGPVERGENELHVALVARDGKAAARLVAVDAVMAAHTHEAHAADIRETEGGFQARQLDLYMSGRWQVDLSLVVDDLPDHVSLPVDVP